MYVVPCYTDRSDNLANTPEEIRRKVKIINQTADLDFFSPLATFNKVKSVKSKQVTEEEHQVTVSDMKKDSQCQILSFDEVSVEVQEEEMTESEVSEHLTDSVAEENVEDESSKQLETEYVSQLDQDTEEGQIEVKMLASPIVEQPSRIAKHSRFVSAIQSELEQLKELN